ncbi:hypothetical protein GWK47_023502 [Chionoecetes opilio]|uniref:Uncharacterized protein n=1 Tax=Chionoecetes opilio TaxID=41210 RepID=A0A8J5CJP0_CHIOP|nr:hypothetical protein GWK47_023502 [Chionoecetes opilio]
MKNFFRSPTCSPVGEGPAKPFRRRGALHQGPVDGQGHLLPQASDAEIPAVADWLREGPSGTRALFVALVYCKQGVRHRSLWKTPLNACSSSRSSRHTLGQKPLPRQQKKALRRHLWYVSQENAGTGLFQLKDLVEEKKQMVKDWTSPPSNKELMRLEGKKMTMSFPPSSFVTSEGHGPSSRNSTRTRASWQRTRHYGRRTTHSRTLGNGHLASQWSTSRRAGHALVQRYLGFPEVGRKGEVSPPVAPPSGKLWGGKRRRAFKKKAF